MKPFLRILFLTISLLYQLFDTRTQAEEIDVLSTTNLQEIWFKDDEFERNADLESQLQKEAFEAGSSLDSLLKAKFKLINGDLKLAKFYLNKIDERKTNLLVVKNRYLATIAFIEGKFEDSLRFLNDPKYFSTSLYPHVCLLKLLNYMAINDTNSIKREKESCLYYSNLTSKNESFWLEIMINSKLNDLQKINRSLITNAETQLTDDEMSKLWLKSGLYLNKEKDLLNILSILPENSYQSKRLREIIAFMYLRSNNKGDKQKALSFIDDIDSANAENIKGSINLQSKEYELAFGHFRLALQKKQDSANSLERAIPLAWILGQWEDGLNMLENNTNKMLDPRNKKAIRIAFLIRLNKFKEAEKELTLLKIDFQNEPPYEVSIMDSYVSLILGEKKSIFDTRKLEESSEKSCKSYDGISCWMALQSMQWNNFAETIKKDEFIYSDKDMTIDSLKEKQKITPIKEVITVDQKDIEELDSANMKLMKTNDQ